VPWQAGEASVHRPPSIVHRLQKIKNMDLTAWYSYPLIALAGVLAGIINTLAGNGSVVTLSLLLFLGLDARVANGTNRIGAITQSGTALLTFGNAGKLGDLGKKGIYFLIITLIGALIGAKIATDIDKDLLEKVIGVLMVVMLGLILIKPKRWLRETDITENINTPLNLLIFFAIGLYAGFIQMGMGIMFLAALVLRAKFSLIDANIIKLIIVFVIIIPVLVIFIMASQVNWTLGITLAVGQSFGAWLAAKFALEHPKASVWVHRLLVVMVVVAIIKLFKLYLYLPF
jgi:uncharacterized membrane protein YfcA